ncbi:MAG: helix-turn-helix domain-containing protein [Acidimicrobiia bacterium]|nr:helix-turn-helix domain-containing protein [Acidimicrobiia bacterium]
MGVPTVVQWPRDDHLRAAAAEAGIPCLLVIGAGSPIPAVGRGEDWVRAGTDERWIAARLAALCEAGRRPGAIVPPVLPRSLDDTAREVAALLAAAPGELVPRSDLEAVARGDLRGALGRVRAALRPLGWSVDPVPGVGYVLVHGADR